MVEKKLILKTFNTVLKNHDYFSNIKTLLREITDSKEEYETLRDDIIQFYREEHDSDIERLICRDNDGEFYDNPFGDSDSVMWEDDMIDASGRSGLFYTGHNHPNTSCFQSYADFRCIMNYTPKYSWTIGKDGLMIVKYNPSNTDDIKFGKIYHKVNQELRVDFEKDCQKDFEELKKDLKHWDDPDHEDSFNYSEGKEKIFKKFIKKNGAKYIKKLNNSYQKQMEGVNCYYAENE